MDCKTNCVKMMHIWKNNMSNHQKIRVQFHLITILIPNQAVHHLNQRHHILDHGHPKRNQIQSRSYMSGGMVAITLNSYTYCLQDVYFYLNLTKLVTQFMNIFKMLAVSQYSFFVEENLDSWHPKTHGPRNYLQSLFGYSHS